MISREEAKRKSVMCSNKTMCCEGLVRAIYDSIGSCGECKNLYQNTYHDICGIHDRCCDEDKETYYCADFERKNDD